MAPELNARRVADSEAWTILSLLILFVALAGWSWGKWPDELVDFGQQLYPPWRLLEGKVLYRDVAYFAAGPLSPYLNRELFAIFGVSIQTLVWANLAILGLIAGLAYALVRSFAGVRAAGAGTAFFLAVFAFSQYRRTGNYNFVLPAAHEATHATLLSLLLIASLLRPGVVGRRAELRRGFATGLLCGLIFLTKAEFVLPAAGAVAVSLLTRPTRISRRELLSLSLAAALPAAGFFVYFSFRQLSPAEAAAGALGSVAKLLTTPVGASPFWKAGMGFDEPLRNSARMLWMTTLFILPLGGLRLVCRAVASRFPFASAAGSLPPLFAGAAAAAALFGLRNLIPWPELPRAFPVLVALSLGALGRQWLRHRDEARRGLLVFGVFSALLLGKILLYCRFYHSGFYLAPWATLFLVACWLGDRPEPGRADAGRRLFQGALTGALAAAALVHLGFSQEFYREKNLEIGKGGDAFYCLEKTPECQALPHLLARLAKLAPPPASLLVLPEGVIVNYLARIPSPARHYSFKGGELAAYGEDALLAAIEASPPEAVLLIHQDTSEFGLGFFGRTPAYGSRIMGWVSAHYRVADTFIREPFTPAGFGAQLLLPAPARPKP